LLFKRLGWKHQQRQALQLAGINVPIPNASARGRTPVFAQFASTLTRREEQVAELVARGLTNRAIAQQLNIKEHTVEAHMTSILSRLGLRSRWQLAETQQ